jgi:CheY-specific phosphatase CheX
MTTDHQDVLGMAFVEVVEQLTFMFGAPVDKAELPRPAKPWIGVHMNFSGAVRGRLSLSVPRETCDEIAANILGMDTEEIDSEELAVDALKEVLNQVCGHVIRIIAGEEADWELQTPVVDTMPCEEVDALFVDEEVLGYSLDENPVLLGLHLEGERGT